MFVMHEATTVREEPLEALEPLEPLEREIAALARRLARDVARWLELVAEFDRRDGGLRWGFRGTAEWLAWRCGIGGRAAREHVRVARRLGELGAVRAAFGRGELSYSKVRAITRAAAPDEQGLLALARTSTADQLERTVRGLRSSPSAGVETANEVHARRRLDWWWELDGSFRVIGRLPADDGAALVQAVEVAAEAMHARPPGATDSPGPLARPPLPARRVDALTEIVQSGAPRAQVVLHVDAPALRCTAAVPEERTGELCTLRDGPAVPSETARRLTCDADLTPARGRSDGTLDLGRARRVVSPALRATLEHRDGSCRFPGCDRRHGLHAHHIEHWAHGGPTDRDNLILLCRYHHRLVHEGGFTVCRDRHDGELRFRRPDGGLLADLPPPLPVAA